MEPDYIPPEDDEDWTCLHKNLGNAIHKHKKELPPRDDIIHYDKAKHKPQFDRNIQWPDTPMELKPRIAALIKLFWDVLDEVGVSRPIRGFLFHIDTGTVQPFSCKTPRYGAHEARVILELVAQLQAEGWIDNVFGPWGSQIVLAAKPDQAHVAWYAFIFGLCVSYQKVNAVTRPFRFPTPRCDDPVRGIRSNYFLTMDLDCGYWQVKLDKMSQEKTVFYVTDGKKHWKVMPMGATNAHPFFVAIVERMHFEWKQLAKTRGIKLCLTTMSRRGKDNPDAKTIVDEVLLYAYSVNDLLEYFEMVLVVLQHSRVTVKLRKCRFIQTIAKFVGMDILSQGNTPAKSKDEAFQKMTYPISFTDLQGFIGFLGFYQEFIPLYEVRIDPFRKLLKEAPPPGSISNEEEASLLEQEWIDEHKKLFNALRLEASSSPMLARPSDEKRFYLRTDWSSLGRGAVLAQPSDDPAAIEAMNREIAGGKCESDLTISNTTKCLQPISFISERFTTQSKKTLHSCMGEAGTGVWAMEKFRFFLVGKEFKWIYDCSGLINFFELPTHQA
jgi:hypothetical protein